MAWFESVAKSCQPWKPFSNAMSIAGPRGRSPPPLAKGLARGPWSNWPLSLQTWMPGVKGLVGENSPPTVACPLTTTEWAVPTWNGYLLSVACPCGVTSMRWVTGPGAMGTARGEQNRKDRARSGVLERTRPIRYFTSRSSTRARRPRPTGRRAIGLLRVFELGSRLQGFLRHSWQDDLVHLLLELRHRHRDIVFAHPQKPADADNGVR